MTSGVDVETLVSASRQVHTFAPATAVVQLSASGAPLMAGIGPPPVTEVPVHVPPLAHR
jgi:hypothetical protein